MLGQLAETVSHYESTIAAFVLMPTHLHAIINLCRVRDLSSLVQAFKSLSARRVKALSIRKFDDKLYRSGGYHLWKARIDDFIIRTPEQFFVKLNYIHENPVRADLVKTAAEYIYSSAADWMGVGRGLIEINREGLDTLWR
jgi:putative transposase